MASRRSDTSDEMADTVKAIRQVALWIEDGPEGLAPLLDGIGDDTSINAVLEYLR